MRSRLRFLWVLAVLSTVCLAHSVAAGVPQMINYQGALTDKNGAAVANGNYTMEFKIYDLASGGTVLWSEKWDAATSQITVVNGLFNVMLGFSNPIPATFFADHPVAYLGITVGVDSEMLPRQQITSVGYAFAAGNGVPKGGIIMWSGAIADIPAGWALCDGVERTREDGTKVTPPDLRDRFIVGAGNGYAVAVVGGESSHVLTIAEMPTHNHVNGSYQYLLQATGGNTTSDTDSSSNEPDIKNKGAMSSVGGGQAHNNLPPYYALAFIMKL